MVILLTLRQFRKMLGLSLRAVEKGTGINRGLLSTYERGLVEPSASKLLTLADFFGLSPNRLLEMLRQGAGDDHAQRRRTRPA